MDLTPEELRLKALEPEITEDDYKKDITVQWIAEEFNAGWDCKHELISYLLNNIKLPLFPKPSFFSLAYWRGDKENELGSKLAKDFFNHMSDLDVSFERTSELFGDTVALHVFKCNKHYR